MRLFVLVLIGALFVFALNINEYPFDKTKIKGYDSSKNMELTIAPIINQYWIASKKLSQQELKDLVLSKYNFKIIGYKRVYGLLIEIDEKDIVQLETIEELKKTKYIDNIYNRVYEGNQGFNIISNKNGK